MFQQVLLVIEEVYRWVLFTLYLFNDKCFWHKEQLICFSFLLLYCLSVSCLFHFLLAETFDFEKGNVTTLIWMSSNFCCFTALYCFGFNTLLALQMKEVGNKSIKSKKRAWKCCKNYCTWRLLFGDFLGPIFNNLLYFSSRPNF